ncbi:MAG: N-acetyl-gamma-glutamyl-phosphate reductase [Alphaproteobacteria bacterium GM202ARS2]|nr:N-acetyl-gamma-glutamyl-phosphate reductase [Alphaproteobacteria bacterium GM202ARS2]
MSRTVAPAKTLNAAILGATGYTGGEMIRLLARHPHVHIHSLSSHSFVGESVHSVLPNLTGLELPTLQAHESIQGEDIDVIFACLPHQQSHTLLAPLAERHRIIDLSADFRLSLSRYQQWYQTEHSAPELLHAAVYGLTELYRDSIRSASLIANPGCYPTAVLLPLLPLLQGGLIESDDIVVDAKSALSGAGRTLKPHLLFCEAQQDITAYGIDGHRHSAEIDEQICRHDPQAPEVLFTPHLVPMNRGILATLYVKTQASPQEVVSHLKATFADDAFVHVTDEHRMPHTSWVAHSNHALIGVSPRIVNNRLVLVCVIDNLVKGAVGQAIQNMNVMVGFDETCGLDSIAPRL